MSAVVAQASTTPVPITPVSAADFAAWLEAQDPATRGWVKANGFAAKADSVCLVPAADGSLARVLAGVDAQVTPWALGHLPMQLPCGEYCIEADWPVATLQQVALGWALGAYSFTRYKPADREPAVLVLDPACDLGQVHDLETAIWTVRDLINTPAADMMPEHLSEAMAAAATDHGASFQEIVGDDLLANNYPVIHAVGRASVHAPRLLDLRWGDESHPRVTLVGKGVCFDSGGLDLKPASGMRLMKKDMGGSAHVIGLARAIMARQLPVRLRVLVPAVENAVSGSAFRPGDVLTARSGKTVEIDNTDAEGRLVLCDALAEAVSEQPDLLIDMATLTGAARVALGTDVPAVFPSRRELGMDLLPIADAQTDPVWPLPLYKPYLSLLRSDIADLVNSASGPYGGAITAALFLGEFVPDDIDWLHLDVMAWNLEARPGRPRGGEAMGLRTLLTYIEQRFS